MNVFDGLWQLVAGIAGALAIWLGGLAAWRKQKADSARRKRLEAEADYIDGSFKRLEEARRRAAGKAPVDPKKRTDFEAS